MRTNYDPTVALLVAGQLLSGTILPEPYDKNPKMNAERQRIAAAAVLMARAIITEVQRTEPKADCICIPYPSEPTLVQHHNVLCPIHGVPPAAEKETQG